MTFDEAAFGADLAATMRCAYEEACKALGKGNIELNEVARKLMALQIMTAVQRGEHGQQRLKDLAIAAVAPQSTSR